MSGVAIRYLIPFLFLSTSTQLTAQVVVVDPQNIVIENLYIAAEGAEDKPVNLLIRKNSLELITKDQIPIPENVVALDAAGGFLLGNLTLGAPPSFIIFDADPRKDLEVLLDTRDSAVFAVYNGELQKNTLQYAASHNLTATPGHSAWHAYTPPPVALPTHYGASNSWNHWTTKNTANTFFSVLALDRQYWISQDDASELQVGNLEEFDGGEVRDLRLGVFGTLNYFSKPWGYTIVFATNAFDERFQADNQNSFKALDYRLDIPVGKKMRLSIGKQKEPISMERTMTLINLPMQERSAAANAMLRSRNFGVLLSGNALNQRMSWAGGLFNDFIDADESLSDADTSVSGRLTWLPFLSADKNNLVHLGFASKLSNGNQGYLYATEPEFDQSPAFVDTGSNDANSIAQYNFEASWRRGPLWLVAEHVGTNVDSPTGGNQNYSGSYATASWIVTGEMRNYNYRSGTFGPVPISRTVNQNGFGALEIATRWSSIDLDDGPVQGGQMDILSLGASWWLLPTFNINSNYRYIFNKQGNLDGESSGINIRILLKLQ